MTSSSSSSAAASTSCVAESNGSTSTIVAAAKPTGHHILKIDGYSRTKALVAAGDCIDSSRFHAGDHTWRIKYYPNGTRSSNKKPDSISLMLELDMAGRAAAAVVKAQFVFILLDQDGEPAPSSTHGSSISSFPSPCGSYLRGYYRFISHDDLEKSEHLNDDRFSVRCEVTVMKGIELRVEPASLAVPEPDLHCHLGRLLSTGDGADVVFKAGGETFPAHRCVLAARSPVFRAALYGDRRRPAPGTCLDVDDMDAGAFRALLHFVYTDTLPEMTSADVPAMARQLIAAADKYRVERLKLVCEDRLSRRVVADDTSMTTTMTDSTTGDDPQRGKRRPRFMGKFVKFGGCFF